MLQFPAALTAYIWCLALLLGLVFGSFCNAWAWRIVHGESIVRGRSHCAVCGHTLAARDLVPLLSWLLLRGRCRYCGEAISRRYPAVEIVSGAYYLSVVMCYGLSWDALRFLLLGSLLLTAALVDLDTFELPNGLVGAAALCAVLRLPASGPGVWRDALLGVALIAVPLLLLVLLADWLLGRETMGGGDIKLVAALGLHFGALQTLFLLIAACLVGLLGVACLRRPGGAPIPFGPALTAAAWLAVLFGGRLAGWYLSLF